MTSAACRVEDAGDDTLVVGLVSDTHGVYDPALADELRGVSLILHAGDVGHHGSHEGAAALSTASTEASLSSYICWRSADFMLKPLLLVEEVLAELRKIAPVTAVRGNVDVTATLEELLEVQLLALNGWRILMTHIVGMPPKVAAAARALMAEHKPDLVVFGHSHVYGEAHEGRMRFINPGSAGPARFKLQRTAALLHLPVKGEGGDPPRLHRIQLAAKAPPKLKPHSSFRGLDASVIPAASNRRRAADKAGAEKRKRTQN